MSKNPLTQDFLYSELGGLEWPEISSIIWLFGTLNYSKILIKIGSNIIYFNS